MSNLCKTLDELSTQVQRTLMEGQEKGWQYKDERASLTAEKEPSDTGDRQTHQTLSKKSDDLIGQEERLEGGEPQQRERGMWARLVGRVKITPLENRDKWICEGKQEVTKEALEQSQLAEEGALELNEQASQLELKLKELEVEQENTSQRLRNLQHEQGETTAEIDKRLWMQEERMAETAEDRAEKMRPYVKGRRDKHITTRSQAQSQQEEMEERKIEDTSEEEEEEEETTQGTIAQLPCVCCFPESWPSTRCLRAQRPSPGTPTPSKAPYRRLYQHKGSFKSRPLFHTTCKSPFCV
ncbi:hypothetical protein Q7C36_016060 [Tachysurus vachellii]|uniref:Uncharacterized protein n=1 Tax=Tachysurus vachellii TaxID=175792 RepID=A0AA88MBM2_TACVA|nr:hypothetical protein Q7C36_016060 [Tachysurus vachellii]